MAQDVEVKGFNHGLVKIPLVYLQVPPSDVRNGYGEVPEITGPLWGESIDSRWNLLTKGRYWIE